MTEEKYFLKGPKKLLQGPINQLIAMRQMLGDGELAVYYGMPASQFHESKRTAMKPQVNLSFLEDAADVASGYRQIEASISFRLMNDTEATMTPAKALVLAQKINTIFGGTTAYRWKKGRELWGYIDPARGYHLHIYAWNETEAKDVIRKVLDIQNHAPDWGDHLKDWAKRDSLVNTPIIPPMDFIYGESRRRPRRLPIGHVRFIMADMLLDGLQRGIYLVDVSGRKPSALVKG